MARGGGVDGLIACGILDAIASEKVVDDRLVCPDHDSRSADGFIVIGAISTYAVTRTMSEANALGSPLKARAQ